MTLSNGDVLTMPDTLLQTKYEEIMAEYAKINDAYKDKVSALEMNQKGGEKSRMAVSSTVISWIDSAGNMVPVAEGYVRLTRQDFIKLDTFLGKFLFGIDSKEDADAKKD